MNHEALLSSLSPMMLALAVASYGQTPAAPIVKTTVTVSTAASALKAPTSKGSSKGKKSAAPISRSSFEISKDPIGASKFLDLLRTAGLRPAMVSQIEMVEEIDPETTEINVVEKTTLIPRLSPDGSSIMAHDPATQILDEKAALISFCGYSVSLAHGTQLDAARLHALSSVSSDGEISAPHRSPEEHAARWSAAGFIAGTPNAIRTMLGDLAARARIASQDVQTFSQLRACALEGNLPLYASLLSQEFPAGNPINDSLKLLKDEALINMLASLEALATARLAAIEEDIAGLDSENPTVEQIARAHAVLLGRGVPSTIEEDFERKSDSHGILDTASRA